MQSTFFSLKFHLFSAITPLFVFPGVSHCFEIGPDDGDFKHYVANHSAVRYTNATKDSPKANYGITFAEDFKYFADEKWRTSSWVMDGKWIDTAWSPRNIAHSSGLITLYLEKIEDRGKSYSGAEFQSRSFFGFGVYEVTMKASGERGVNSTFFTYTGPAHSQQKNEIDFEFLGKAPTKVHLAYHSSDTDTLQGANHRFVDLGFDSSSGFHTYRFEWKENCISWYADDRILWTVSGSDKGIPTKPGKIFGSIWTGAPGWLGEADFEQTEAVYSSVRYTTWDDYDKTADAATRDLVGCRNH